MFRLDMLGKIASDRCSELGITATSANDEMIGVHLAYQVMLRDRLGLSHAVPRMAFPDNRAVSPDRAAEAGAEVLAREADQILNFLSSEWGPWDAVAQRIAPAEYAEMRERLLEAMDEPFQTRLGERLSAMGLTGDADAERELGSVIMQEITQEIKGEFTRRVLAPHNIAL